MFVTNASSFHSNLFLASRRASQFLQLLLRPLWTERRKVRNRHVFVTCGILVGIGIIAAATLAVVVAAEAVVVHRIVHQLLHLLVLLRASPRTLARRRQRPCVPAGTTVGIPTTAEDRMADRMADRMVRHRHHRRLVVRHPLRVVEVEEAETAVRRPCRGVQLVLPRGRSCRRVCVPTGTMGGITTLARALECQLPTVPPCQQHAQAPMLQASLVQLIWRHFRIRAISTTVLLQLMVQLS